MVYFIRKSFWVFCKGFRKEKLNNWNLIDTLQKIFNGRRNLSGEKFDEYCKNICFLGDQYSEAQDKLTIAKSLADKWGDIIIEMLNPVWERQKKAIQQVMKGGKATLCYYKMNCRDRAQCFSAHSDNELIPLVRDNKQIKTNGRN